MISEGTLLWEPSDEFKKRAQVTLFMKWLRENKGVVMDDYDSLWKWSVDEMEDFWQAIWEYFDVESSSPFSCVLETKDMPGARWFPGARVNLAKHIFRQREKGDIAIFSQSEIRPLEKFTWEEIQNKVLILANELRKLGVQPGDRIAAFLPNIPEATIALLAAASIGAVWSSCSPDFGSKSVLDRFKQIEPKVLFTIDGYKYGGKTFDRRKEVCELLENLPTVNQVIYVPYLYEEDEKGEFPIKSARIWDELMNQPVIPLSQFQFEDVPFEHPLWIVYSSGTTGIPKGIVHSHGGILLERYKGAILHSNLGPESCTFIHTTTGWVMFNIAVTSLLSGSSIVLFDGNPTYPDVGRLWGLIEKAEVTSFSISPTFINMVINAGLSPMKQFNLSKLVSISLGGSPASPELCEWLYKNVNKDLWLSSGSGGTDIASGFVGGIPINPVHAGEMQCRFLGVAVHAFNDIGEPVIDEVGELVVTKPMPSMPIFFWNDQDNKRYLESYFKEIPGVWRHGDYLKITSRGTCIIYGRSDSTLNRYGVRIGTSEIYSVVEAIESVHDSIIVNLDLPQGRFFMPIFVILKPGMELDDAIKKEITDTIRKKCSPRHVPDEIFQVEAIPYTLTGKKMEVPIRKILMGAQENKATNRDAMANPGSLDYFLDFARSENYIPLKSYKHSKA
ncbi:acetoacetate--CoA ligase [Peribacillus frigoritolerans]|uniref:acetoacetate--CoA ligase n=1 Tax=Peribacillus frigoritolerans TaxID=450367 RepID=UPI00201C01E3|nr:acetoacetate--CoA ligase [Peribacillus frigoritolerans]